jgi:hypothetical protein
MAGKSQLNGHLNGTSMNIYENNLSRIWRQNEINRIIRCRVGYLSISKMRLETKFREDRSYQRYSKIRESSSQIINYTQNAACTAPKKI